MPDYERMSTSNLIQVLHYWEQENRRKPTRKGTRTIVAVKAALAKKRKA